MANRNYKTHGLSRKYISEYRAWMSMKNRCYNKNSASYKNYGGRGIIVCDEWINDFSRFLTDMGEKPSLSHTLDRIRVNENYTKDNCKWSTKFEQNNNQRRTKRLTYNGETRSLGEWAKHLGIKYTSIVRRFESGLPPEIILSNKNIQVKYEYSDNDLIDLMSKGLNFSEIAEKLNAGYYSVYHRACKIRKNNPELIATKDTHYPTDKQDV